MGNSGNEKQAGVENKQGVPPLTRRQLLIAGLIPATPVFLSAINKYLLPPPEEERNFSKQFEGQEHKYGVALKAIDMLISEMDNGGIKTVGLIGVKYRNYRIKVLGDFLTSHLKLRGVGDKYNIKEKIIKQGFYTKVDLVALREETINLNYTTK